MLTKAKSYTTFAKLNSNWRETTGENPNKYGSCGKPLTQ